MSEIEQPSVDLWDLRVGSRLELDEDVVAEVTAPTRDGRWIKVRYVRVPSDPRFEGTDDLCSEDEIRRVIG